MKTPRSVLLGRVPIPGEAVWTEQDVNAVLDFLEEEKLACPGCGSPRDETMHPDAEGKWISKGWVCFKCRANETASEQFREAKGNMKGMHFIAEERD